MCANTEYSFSFHSFYLFTLHSFLVYTAMYGPRVWEIFFFGQLVFENWDDIFKLLCPMGQWMFPNIIGLWYCLVFGYFLSPVSCKPTGFCNPMHCGKKKVWQDHDAMGCLQRAFCVSFCHCSIQPYIAHLAKKKTYLQCIDQIKRTILTIQSE